MGRGCRLRIAVAPGHMRYRHGTTSPGTGASRRGPSLCLHVGPCDNTIRVPVTRILCVHEPLVSLHSSSGRAAAGAGRAAVRVSGPLSDLSGPWAVQVWAGPRAGPGRPHHTRRRWGSDRPRPAPLTGLGAACAGRGPDHSGREAAALRTSCWPRRPQPARVRARCARSPFN